MVKLLLIFVETKRPLNVYGLFFMNFSQREIGLVFEYVVNGFFCNSIDLE